MITQIRKFKNPFPMILALLSTFISIIDKLIFAKDIRIFSPVIAIGGAAFLLLILPYLIPVLCNKVKSERIRKILNWFSIGKRPGLMLAWLGSVSLFFLTIGSLIAALLFGVGTKGPKVLMQQLNWPFYAERKFSGNGGAVETKLYSQYKGKSNVIKITFDTRNKDSYAGWLVTFGDVSFLQRWSRYPYVSFLVRAEDEGISHILFGIKDKDGLEVKRELSSFTNGRPLYSSQWRSIEIDVTKLSSDFHRPLDWQNLDNVSFSLGHIDPDYSKNYVSFFISELVFWENN